ARTVRGLRDPLDGRVGGRAIRSGGAATRGRSDLRSVVPTGGAGSSGSGTDLLGGRSAEGASRRDGSRSSRRAPGRNRRGALAAALGLLRLLAFLRLLLPLRGFLLLRRLLDLRRALLRRRRFGRHRLGGHRRLRGHRGRRREEWLHHSGTAPAALHGVLLEHRRSPSLSVWRARPVAYPGL